MLGNLNILSFVRISRLNQIGPLIKMDNKRKLRKVFNNNPQGNDEESDQTVSVTVYRQIFRKCKIHIQKDSLKKI